MVWSGRSWDAVKGSGRASYSQVNEPARYCFMGAGRRRENHSTASKQHGHDAGSPAVQGVPVGGPHT